MGDRLRVHLEQRRPRVAQRYDRGRLSQRSIAPARRDVMCRAVDRRSELPVDGPLRPGYL
jgi:hypothetical protein